MRQAHGRGPVLIALAVAVIVVLPAGPLVGMRARSASGTPVGSPAVADPLVTQGQQVYDTICVACHQPGGKGVPGVFPALAGNQLVTLDDPQYVIATLITGRGAMPQFGAYVTDDQIAAAVSYIRQAWGNRAGPVTPAQVEAIRQSLAAPASPPPAVPATPTA
jgi:cytochrome c6